MKIGLLLWELEPSQFFADFTAHYLKTNKKFRSKTKFFSGGPGSNKTLRAEEIADMHPTWNLISVGRSLWNYLQREYPEGLAETTEEGEEDELQPGESITSNMVKSVMRKGEMVPQVT